MTPPSQLNVRCPTCGSAVVIASSDEGTNHYAPANHRERTELEAGLWALTVGGWEVTKASLYDEEGVEGWRWDGPDGQEGAVIGDWEDLPGVPEIVVEAYRAWGKEK